MSEKDLLEKKIVSRKEAASLLREWNDQGLKVVFSNGCFDLVHQGHINYLYRAAKLGDRLIIGLNTDASVRRLKGESRPIQDEFSRAYLLAAFFFVDLVVLFDEDTPLDLITDIQPDVLVKGSDYKVEDIVGFDVLRQKGGEIVTLDFVEGFSSSSIIERINNLSKE